MAPMSRCSTDGRSVGQCAVNLRSTSLKAYLLAEFGGHMTLQPPHVRQTAMCKGGKQTLGFKEATPPFPVVGCSYSVIVARPFVQDQAWLSTIERRFAYEDRRVADDARPLPRETATSPQGSQLLRARSFEKELGIQPIGCPGLRDRILLS